jgi:hypothetical protein
MNRHRNVGFMRDVERLVLQAPTAFLHDSKACATQRWQNYRATNPLDTGERTQICQHCTETFTYAKVTKARMYCTERCRMQAATRQAPVHVRQCACGSTAVARVGKPVCPDCKVDKRDPLREREKERRRTLRLYSITLERFDELLATQHGRCAICTTDDPGRGWQIDHDHACCPGKGSCGHCVRGLLCTNCNLMLGHAEDNPDRLLQAITYLQQHAPIG